MRVIAICLAAFVGACSGGSGFKACADFYSFDRDDGEGGSYFFRSADGFREIEGGNETVICEADIVSYTGATQRVRYRMDKTPFMPDVTVDAQFLPFLYASDREYQRMLMEGRVDAAREELGY